VGQVDGQDGQEENTVAEVLQKGYRMGGKVIRYSMVHVVR
jgi:molecular chaperone GrpE (heat shock protein)